MNDVRFEYNNLWMDAVRDWVHVVGMPVSAQGMLVWPHCDDCIAEVLDHSCFHRKIDQVERNETYNILPRTHQNKSHKQIGDLPKPKQCQSYLPDLLGSPIKTFPYGQMDDALREAFSRDRPMQIRYNNYYPDLMEESIAAVNMLRARTSSNPISAIKERVGER